MTNSSQAASHVPPSGGHENTPYVGPRPFTRADQDIFFGRNQEAIELTSLVKAHPEVLLYAQSGAGKTSLLFAQVIPILDAEEEFDVLPTARVRSQESSPIPEEKISNIYMFNAFRDLSDDKLSVIERAQLTLAEYLKRKPRPPVKSVESVPSGETPELRLPRVVIFDQFEEIFTLYPERYKDRQDFFTQVSAALEADQFLRVIFSMREDYIAELDPYVDVLPQSLRTRFRLERLRKINALSAVKQPLETDRVKDRRQFAPGAAELLVDRLMLIKVKTASGEKIEVPGEFVDPVQLQVVCQTFWEKLPPEKTIITKEDLDKYANVDEALSNFYESCVRKAVTSANSANKAAKPSEVSAITEGAVRGWFEQKLITREGKRNMVFREGEMTAGLSNVVVDELENQHVIRVEMRGGEPWYELSHDRFIPPIRESNRRFLLQQPLAKQKAQELEARADEWLKSRRSDSLLLNRFEWLDAKAWMDTEAAAAIGYTDTLVALIGASGAAIEHEENKQQQMLAEAQRLQMIAEQKRARQLKIGFVVASLLLVCTLASTGLAINRWRHANAAEAKATVNYKQAQAALEEAKAASFREREERKRAEDVAGKLKIANEQAEAQRAEADKARKSAEEDRARADREKESAQQARHQTEVALSDTRAAKAQVERANAQLQALSSRLSESRQKAWSLKLSADANSALSNDPELSLRLAIEAAKRLETEQAKYVMRRAFMKSKDRSVLRGHKDVVWKAAYGPNGRVFTISEDGTVGIWDPETRREQDILHVGAAVHAFAITSDGTRLATEEFADRGSIWDLSDTKRSPIRLTDLTGPVAALAFSPDGKLLATEATDKDGKPGAAPRIWDATSGKTLTTLRGHDNAVCAVAFSPSGDLLATASWDNTARIWEVKTGRELVVLRGHTAPLTSVTFDGSGQFVITGSFDGTARVWNANTGTEKLVLRGHEGVVQSAVFSPNNKLIVTAGKAVNNELVTVQNSVPLPPELAKRAGTPDNAARVWDAQTGALITVLRGHSNDVNSAVFSSDSKFVVTASRDGTANVWFLPTGELISQLKGHGGPVNSAVFSSDNSSVLTASDDNTAQIWRLKNKKEIEFQGHRGAVESVGFNSNSSIVTSGADGTVRFWDLRTGEETSKITVKTTPVYSVAISPNGMLAVTSSRENIRARNQPSAKADTNVHVWEIKAQKFLPDLTGHTEPVTKVLFSPHGQYVLSLSPDAARVWDVSNWKSIEVLTVQKGDSQSKPWIVDGTFDPEEKYVTIAQNNGTLQIWEKATGQIKSVQLENPERIVRVAFSHNGDLIVTMSIDMTIRVWTTEGKSVSTLLGHPSNVYRMAFSEDNRLVITASLGGTIRVWETGTGGPITEFNDLDDFASVALSADNTSVIAGDFRGAVHVLDCEACRPFEEIKKMALDSKPRLLTSLEREQYIPDEKETSP